MCSTRAVDGLIHMIIFETDYDKWLCVVVLFELDTGLSGVFARGVRTEERGSACRVESLGRPHVAPARLAGQCGIVVTPRGPGSLHMLSIPYELLGDKGVSSAELKKGANFHSGTF